MMTSNYPLFKLAFFIYFNKPGIMFYLLINLTLLEGSITALPTIETINADINIKSNSIYYNYHYLFVYFLYYSYYSYLFA